MLLVLLASLSLHAAEPVAGGRWLLIFDTSASMKKLQPETVAAAKELFTTSAEGQLQPGDSMAIWTVSQQVASQFQPFIWSPDQCDAAVSNLTVFLQQQPYATPSQLAALRTPLNSVVAGSRLLTAVIFTDGQTDLSGTPYDEGINQALRDQRAERTKSPQLFMLVLRSDRGRFVGCTMNFPPGAISLPPFPAQPVVTNKPATVASASSAVSNSALNSLVIVGNSVSTNGSKPVESFIPKSAVPIATNPAPPAPAKAASVTTAPSTAAATNPPPAPAKPAVTNPSPILAKPVVTNPPVVAVRTSAPPPVTIVTAKPAPVMTTNLSRTNPPAATTTSAAPAPPATPAPSRMIYWVLAGVGLLALVGVAAVLALRRPTQGSLISASMDDENRPRR